MAAGKLPRTVLRRAVVLTETLTRSGTYCRGWWKIVRVSWAALSPPSLCALLLLPPEVLLVRGDAWGFVSIHAPERLAITAVCFHALLSCMPRVFGSLAPLVGADERPRHTRSSLNCSLHEIDALCMSAHSRCELCCAVERKMKNSISVLLPQRSHKLASRCQSSVIQRSFVRCPAKAVPRTSHVSAVEGLLQRARPPA